MLHKVLCSFTLLGNNFRHILAQWTAAGTAGEREKTDPKEQSVFFYNPCGKKRIFWHRSDAVRDSVNVTEKRTEKYNRAV